MSTLTDRYVHATVRSVPESRRDELGRELRTSIDDMVEARLDAGEDRESAERVALSEMGDPAELAAQYADRALHLIGPRYFLTYWRLLIKLLTWIPAAVGLVVLTVSMIESPSVGDAIGDGVTAVVEVALHVAFWTTLAFAIIERVDVDPGLPRWSVDDLPETPQEREITLVDTVAAVVFIVLLGVVLVGQTFRTWVQGPDGDDVAVLDPDLWSAGWLPLLLAVLVANVGLEVWKYRTGRWTWPIAGTFVVISVVFAAPLMWLASQDTLLNSAFVDAVGMSATVLERVNLGVVLVVAAIAVSEIVEALWKTRQAENSEPAALR